MPLHDSTLVSGECYLNVMDSQDYGASKPKIRPTLRIDTSGAFLSSGPSYPNSISNPPRSSSRSAHSGSPHPVPEDAPSSNTKTPQWNGGITPRAESKIQQSNVGSTSESPEPGPSNSPYPLESYSEADLAENLQSSVYDREIIFIDVEDKDGYKSIRTIIRPTTTGSSSRTSSSRPSMISAVSPLTSLFSRSSTPPLSKLKLHSAQLTDAPRSPWHMPSLGISTRKAMAHRSSNSTNTSSQYFEEEVDYLQAKLEKEAMGGDGAIRIEMKVEISVSCVERQRRRPRWRFERYRLRF